MLPRSLLLCLSASRREEQHQPPDEWKTHPPLGRRWSPRQTTGQSFAPLAPRLQPLPEQGGPPHATRRRLPPSPPPPAAHVRVAVAFGSKSVPPPARTHAQHFPRQVGVSALAATAATPDDSAHGSARHFLIRLLRAQSQQPPRRLRHLECACVITCPAGCIAGEPAT